MATESKSERRVRFTLPEPKKQYTSTKESKGEVHKTLKLKSGIDTAKTVKVKTPSTSSIIVNKNAVETNACPQRLLSDLTVKGLPKINKSHNEAKKQLTSANKRGRPKSSVIRRSESFKIKKISGEKNETCFNKRFSDSFLYMGCEKFTMPSLKVTEPFDNTYSKINISTEHDLNPNYLRIPFLEDDNANYIPEFLKGLNGSSESIENQLSIMKGKLKAL